jgi:hypothetical protein
MDKRKELTHQIAELTQSLNKEVRLKILISSSFSVSLL